MKGSGTDIDGVFRYLRGDLRTVEKALVAHLQSPVPLIPVVGKHITLSGGKRFRPAVLLLVAEACGYTGPRRIVMAVVTEYMHNATLLHDDVVDGGTVRRGKPSANVVYGNSVSILVGDFLFARASQLMTEDGDLDVLGIYARTLVHLSEGEVLQLMKSADRGITENDYLRVVFHKTASLIAAASETGAVLAGADGTLRRRMFEYGRSVGIAFQLMDDVLDYVGSEKELGKRPLQDLREGKITLPLIHALREAGDGDRRKAGEILDRRRFSDREITFLAGMVRRNGGLEYTRRRARAFVKRGKRLLAHLPAAPARDALASLSDYIVSRTH
ncbi:MAG TPA: polyprenyl synthetase family protein [Candidatus Deferrimicrobiaceae bacterium]|nr:polyprenyl synthetase family protein [Candidatus Deferrimicrobiaceae bacterium]